MSRYIDEHRGSFGVEPICQTLDVSMGDSEARGRDMTSKTRVPPAEITGIFGAMAKRLSKKKLGQVPEPLGVMWHNRRVLKTFFGFSGKAEKWDACDTQLKSLAHMASVSLVGCSFCLDLGYLQAHNEKLDVDKAREVPRWRESGVFTPLERDVLEYAEAMSQTPPAVTDEMSARLLDQLGAPALVELTAFIGAANMVSRNNTALGIESQGFSAACGLQPLDPGGSRSLVGMSGDPFVTHRSLLFTVAYEMLGSAADAEDVVQETWVRWADVAQDEVRDPRAYLVRIVTRQALDRLRTVARRRESYVGVWLPEPLLTSPDVAEDVELVESVSFAMLTVLETLGPVERAVFVLRDVFDVPYEEIEEAVGKSAAAVRQIAHRAREHVTARRPRMSVSRADQQAAVERFQAALTTGDLQGLLDVLAPDVVFMADGGGVVPAAIRPLSGAKTVARQLARFPALAPGARIATSWLNGAPALRIDPDGEFDSAVSLTVEGGRITRIYVMRNPHKLAGLDRVASLTR